MEDKLCPSPAPSFYSRWFMRMSVFLAFGISRVVAGIIIFYISIIFISGARYR